MQKLTINLITPGLSRTKFAGGTYCLLKYADGLAKRGHQVNVIPYRPSKKPIWVNCSANYLLNGSRDIFNGKFKDVVKNLNSSIDKKLFNKKNDYSRRALILDYMSYMIPEGDITIATSWDSAELVFRFGTGKKAYFMQHFEPLFFEGDSFERRMCEFTYQLPLYKIANSSWLKATMDKHLENLNIKDTVRKCINAVDLDVYKKQSSETKKIVADKVKIISYGGRGVAWKGFAEMAEAVAIVRNQLKNCQIEWQVFGSAALPADNQVAPYTSLGFLQPKDLCRAYNEADILLSASWYESFPLFPIEGMACGLPAITTAKGTEDYAFHGDTAEIVEERNPESIAQGLVKVITDLAYRKSLITRGYEQAQCFSWTRSIDNMEKVLADILSA